MLKKGRGFSKQKNRKSWTTPGGGGKVGICFEIKDPNSPPHHKSSARENHLNNFSKIFFFPHLFFPAAFANINPPPRKPSLIQFQLKKKAWDTGKLKREREKKKEMIGKSQAGFEYEFEPPHGPSYPVERKKNRFSANPPPPHPSKEPEKKEISLLIFFWGRPNPPPPSLRFDLFFFRGKRGGGVFWTIENPQIYSKVLSGVGGWGVCLFRNRLFFRDFKCVPGGAKNLSFFTPIFSV